MSHTHTHSSTYAVLEIADDAFQEILGRLRMAKDADFYHAPKSGLIVLGTVAIKALPVKTGTELITRERVRQVCEEKWSAQHDDTAHKHFELTRAAISYATAVAEPDKWALKHGKAQGPCHDWPWAKKWWKPSADPIRNLVKAGALIAAEIDRLLRKTKGGLPGMDKKPSTPAEQLDAIAVKLNSLAAEAGNEHGKVRLKLARELVLDAVTEAQGGN